LRAWLPSEAEATHGRVANRLALNGGEFIAGCGVVKASVDQLNVRGKRALVRVDFNVPLDPQGRITNDLRVREALPTIQKLLDGGGRLVLMSHLGRPEGRPDAKYSLAPVAARLSYLVGKPAAMLPDCVGPAVASAVAALRDGELCLLENLRFHEEETIADKKAEKDAALNARKEAFARQLAELGEVYINDAFGTCHRDNASMLTVPRLMEGKPRVVGYLVQKELKFLGEAVAHPQRPFVVVLGGAKVSDKLGVIRALLGKCDTILIGGAMAYTFLAAEGVSAGKSLMEPELFDVARSLRKEAGDRLRIPVDSVVASELKPNAAASVREGPIPSECMGLDIGPRTVAHYRDVLATAQTIIWNGPMGVFETPPFDAGTMTIAHALAAATERGAVTIVGGGDSAAAVERAGVSNRISHVSTGGGASLEFLEGKAFAALNVLDDLSGG
jgi:phosphoglycerate kinase